MDPKPLGQKIIVATPIGDNITCKKLVEGCPIIIERRKEAIDKSGGIQDA
jgi:hypothetical protein